MFLLANLNSVPEWLRPLIELISQMLLEISGKNISMDMDEWLKFIIPQNTSTEIVDKVTESISTFGLGMLAFYFLMAVLEKVSNGEAISMDMFFKLFLKFIIGFFFITNAADIFYYAKEIGTIVYGLISKFASVSSGQSYHAFRNQLNDAVADYFIDNYGVPTFIGTSWQFWTVAPNLWSYLCTLLAWVTQFIGSLFWLLIPWLFSKSVYFASLTVFVIREFEMIIRAAFAPLAIANTSFDNKNPWGKKYLKQYLALCIQKAFIIAIIIVVGLVSEVATQTPQELAGMLDSVNMMNSGPLWISILFRIAAAGLITNSKAICEDITGAR